MGNRFRINNYYALHNDKIILHKIIMWHDNQTDLADIKEELQTFELKMKKSDIHTKIPTTQLMSISVSVAVELYTLKDGWKT